jgi:Raf kinase inhibitor-like YbhB/YbcL family protein
MKITSSAFEHNTLIPSKYTCEGQSINPPLSIKDIPVGAKSLALIVDDPDAPMKTWVHWVAWNISPDTTEIAENSSPAGCVEGTTSFGSAGYGGPCPPSGTHRYFFKIFALDKLLNLRPGAYPANLTAAMENHIIDKCEFIGLYKKKN